ncbi:MAG: anthranilate phosphoribosyltransferase [SAR324 cluster bacterium]|nr:anthranilate phosphoribosyltransferase [SAR324 cluster bacterium]
MKEKITIKDIIAKLQKRDTLATLEAEFLISQIIEKKIAPEVVGAALALISTRFVETQELVGFAKFLLSKAIIIDHKIDNLVDVVGTGGDYHSSLNISSATSLVISAAGYKVAKHGNRAVTSLSGSEEVFRHLGINPNVSPQLAKQALLTHGFCFLLAPIYHSALKNVANIRRELGFRSIFNFLGPLLNPTRPSVMLLGTSEVDLLEKYAKAALQLGCTKGVVVHGFDGLDEVSNTNKSYIQEFDTILGEKYIFDPTEYGFKLYHLEQIKGKDPAYNAQKIIELLQGKASEPFEDVITLNAGFLLKKLENISLAKAFSKARQIIKSGAGYDKLKDLQNFYKSN